MTWTEWGVLLLVGERGFAIACGLVAGGRAVYRSARGETPPPASKWRGFTAPTTTGVPESVEIASDHGVALDYSSGTKRH